MGKPVCLLACIVIATSLPARLQADDPALDAAYGRGVHAYYAGNFQQSHDTLSRVIAMETQDPRVYYFRGLAALQLGRRDEAIADFSDGADLEAQGWSVRTVSRSMERVQGPDRLLLERSRTRARLAVAQARRPEARSMSDATFSGPRYSGIGGGPSAAPRKPRRPTAMPKPASPFDEPSESTEPPAIDSAMPSPESPPPTAKPVPTQPAPTMKPAPKKPAMPADPFGDDPFDDDPFGLGMGSPRRGRSDTQRDQIDAQNELRAAEATDVLDQREAMAERDAAAGDR